MLVHYLNLVAILSCAIFATFGSSVRAAEKVKTTSDQSQPCEYSKNNRKGYLPHWMQEDPKHPSEELMQLSSTSFQGPYGTGNYLINIKHGKVHLENRAQDGRLRMLEITTRDDQITYMYLHDNSKCEGEIGGNIPKDHPKIKGVKALTLIGGGK